MKSNEANLDTVRDRHWYRWVILFASFVCRVVTFGTVFSARLYINQLSKQII